jgi:biotin carboxyl carrier protein
MSRELKKIDSLYNTIFENKKMVFSEADISGIDELVYNPATKRGGTVGFGFDGGKKVDGITWSGHDDHLHIGFTNRDVAMDVIDKANEMGLRTTENPYAKKDPNGKVDDVHTKGSFHYKTFEGEPPVGAGVDISGNKDTITELIKWTVDKYSGGNYTVDPTSTDSDSSTTTDSDKSKKDSKISYGVGNSKDSDPELYKMALGIGKLIGLNEQFGKNISNRYGTISIPGSSNSVIKSPVDGVINNMKKISGCKNQITIESSDLGYFFQYCGITKPRVKDGDTVSEGQVIGMMDGNDVAEVLMLNRSYHRENLNQKEFEKTYSEKKSTKKKKEYTPDYDGEVEKKSDTRSYVDPALAALITLPFNVFKNRYDKKTGELKQKRWAETGEKKQTDPIVINAIKTPFKKAAKFFRKEKNEESEKLKENIERIKKLLK